MYNINKIEKIIYYIDPFPGKWFILLMLLLVKITLSNKF